MKNIFMIICDELRCDTLGFMGDKTIRTPHLDRLSKDSVMFERCYCDTPMCVPSRVSLATGRYALSHGALDNVMTPMADETSLYGVMQDHGYVTYNHGKWHTNRDANQFGMTYNDTGESQLVNPEKAISPFGINDKESRKGVTFKRNYGEIPLILHGMRPTKQEETLDTIVTHNFMNALDEIKREGKPAFARLSLLDPHSPYFPTEEYYEMYDEDDMVMPESFMASLKTKPILQQYFHKARGFDRLEREDYTKSKACYYSLITNVDDRVGMVIEKLKALDLYEDSMIIFTSDHGCMMGEHGYVEKWGHMYEEVTHCPLMIKLPKSENKGRRVSTFVQLLDLMPTVLDFAGATIPDNVHGRSLMPILRGETDHHRDAVYCQYFCGSLQDTPAIMVRDDKWKLSIYPDQDTLEDKLYLDHPLRMTGFFDGETVRGELYDLEHDPYELNNLFDMPPYASVQSTYAEMLSEWKKTIAPVAYIPADGMVKNVGMFALIQGGNMKKVKQYIQSYDGIIQLEERN